MIIKGKNRADIARQLGISRQAFYAKVKNNKDALFMDEDCNLCYEVRVKKNLINYDPFFKGNFISRNQYTKKYNVSLSLISYMIKNKKLFTTIDGRKVADMKIILDGKPKKDFSKELKYVDIEIGL